MKEPNKNQIAASIVELVSTLFLENRFFQNNGIPTHILLLITKDLVKNTKETQEEKFSLTKELSILYKDVFGIELEENEKTYKYKNEETGELKFHSIDPVEEFFNGIKYATGAFLLKNFLGTIFSSVSSGLISHIPYILGYTGMSYFGQQIISRIIEKTLSTFNLSDNQRKILIPWLNVVARLTLGSITPKVSSTEDGEIVYQYPSDKKRFDIYGSNGQSQIYGDEYLTEWSIRDLVTSKGKYPVKDTLYQIESISSHKVEIFVTKNNKTVPVSFTKQQIKGGQPTISVESPDKELKLEWTNYFFNINTVGNNQAGSKIILPIEGNQQPSISLNEFSLFTKTNSLRAISKLPRDKIHDLLNEANRKIKQIEKNPSNNHCKYKLNYGFYLLVFKKNDINNYALTSNELKLGSGSFGTVSKSFPLVKNPNGHWEPTDTVRAYKQLKDLKEYREIALNQAALPSWGHILQNEKWTNRYHGGSMGTCQKTYSGTKEDIMISDMPLIPGKTLSNFKDIAFIRKISIGAQLLNKIIKLREDKSGHRDLNTGNILYDREKDTITLIDFGETFQEEDLKAVSRILLNLFSKDDHHIEVQKIREILEETYKGGDALPIGSVRKAYEFFDELLKKNQITQIIPGNPPVKCVMEESSFIKRISIALQLFNQIQAIREKRKIQPHLAIEEIVYEPEVEKVMIVYSDKEASISNEQNDLEHISNVLSILFYEGDNEAQQAKQIRDFLKSTSLTSEQGYEFFEKLLKKFQTIEPISGRPIHQCAEEPIMNKLSIALQLVDPVIYSRENNLAQPNFDTAHTRYDSSTDKLEIIYSDSSYSLDEREALSSIKNKLFVLFSKKNCLEKEIRDFLLKGSFFSVEEYHKFFKGIQEKIQKVQSELLIQKSNSEKSLDDFHFSQNFLKSVDLFLQIEKQLLEQLKYLHNFGMCIGENFIGKNTILYDPHTKKARFALTTFNVIANFASGENNALGQSLRNTLQHSIFPDKMLPKLDKNTFEKLPLQKRFDIMSQLLNQIIYLRKNGFTYGWLNFQEDVAYDSYTEKALISNYRGINYAISSNEQGGDISSILSFFTRTLNSKDLKVLENLNKVLLKKLVSQAVSKDIEELMEIVRYVNSLSIDNFLSQAKTEEKNPDELLKIAISAKSFCDTMKEKLTSQAKTEEKNPDELLKIAISDKSFCATMKEKLTSKSNEETPRFTKSM